MIHAKFFGLSISQPYWLPLELFDLNGDKALTQADVEIWVRDIKRTYFGDVNLDGEFNSQDLTLVYQSGHYTIEEEPLFRAYSPPVAWSDGDWNSDGLFTATDLILAFQDGGYEAGPRPPAAAVPEPSGLGACVALVLLGYTRRCRTKRARQARETYEPSFG